MLDVQPVNPNPPVIPPQPVRAAQPILPVGSGTVPAVTASGVPIVPGDPRFMTRDDQGRLVNPDGSVFVPEDQPRTVQQAISDMEAEINHVWHATPSGTESSTVRLRALLREIRGFADPNSAQAKADKAKAEEAKKVEAARLAGQPVPVDAAAAKAKAKSDADAKESKDKADAQARLDADAARARAAGQAPIPQPDHLP